MPRVSLVGWSLHPGVKVVNFIKWTGVGRSRKYSSTDMAVLAVHSDAAHVLVKALRQESGVQPTMHPLMHEILVTPSSPTVMTGRHHWRQVPQQSTNTER